MRLKQNPTLLKAIHLVNEQLISRKNVMISYSWDAEKEAVVQIADAIAGAGIEVWRDETRHEAAACDARSYRRGGARSRLL